MKEYRNDSLSWLEFDIFQPYRTFIRHGCFTRQGGVSHGPYDSLNVGTNVGDIPTHVVQNRSLITKSLGIPAHLLFDVEQVHKTNHVLVNIKPTSHIQADILLTDKPNYALMIKHADCQAALLYDPEHHVCAAVHAGWRGLVQKAYTKALLEMKKLWNTNPQCVLVGISPSLGLCHSEFLSWKEDFPPELWPFQRGENKMDLLAIAQQELLQAGILAEHLEIAHICTYDTPERFFSYRREKMTGRTATCIKLLPQLS